MRPQKYIIGFAIFAFLTFVFGCGSKEDYQIEKIFGAENLNRFTNNSAAKLASTTQFLTLFVHSYRETVRTNVRPEFYGKFPLLITNLDAQVVFSETAETALLIRYAKTNTLTVNCTYLPVQFVLFGGKDLRAEQTSPLNQLAVLKSYNEYSGTIGIHEGSWNFIGKLTLSSKFPKVVTVPTNSLVLFHGVRIEVTNTLIKRAFDVSPIGIITGGLDFTSTLSLASAFAKKFAEFEIRVLFFSSDLFRASLAHPELKSIAQEMVEKMNEQKAGTLEYEYWQFIRDKERLLEIAKRWGLEDAYADDFFQDYRSTQAGATLFWKFESNKGFTIQWTLFNALFVLVALTARRQRRSAKWLRTTQLILLAGSGVNIWIFSQKPNSAGFTYWILPGVLFLIAFLPLWFRRHEYAAKRKLEID